MKQALMTLDFCRILGKDFNGRHYWNVSEDTDVGGPYQNQADLSRTLRIGTFPNHKKIILNSAKDPHKISEYLLGKNTIFDIPFVVFIFIIQGI